MKIQIEKGVFEKFHPRLKIAFILVKNLDNSSKLKESRHILKEIEDYIRLTFNKENAKTHGLIAPWKVAQKEFGLLARHYCTSLEKLLDQTLQKKKIVSDNVLSNLLCYLSLKHLTPFGADDFDKISGGLTFAFKKTGPKKGDLYYHDSSKILGAKLDYWKNPRTALKGRTKSALVHFEFLPPFDQRRQSVLLKEAEELIRTFCGGKIKILILDQKASFRQI